MKSAPYWITAEPDAFLFHYRKIGGGRRYTIASLPEQTDWGHPDPEAGFEYVSKEPLYAIPSIAQPEPTETMLNAARDWSAKKYGKPIGDEAARGCWQAMLVASPERPEK